MKQLVSIWLMFSVLSVHAQTRSFDVWASISTGGEVFKNFDVSLEEGMRLSDFNQSLWYQDLSAKYALTDYLRITATWRYGGRGNLLDVDAIDNRFQIDASGKYEIVKDFEVALRARYQKRYRDMFVSEDGFLSSDYLRLRPTAAYSISKDFSVYGGGELFFQTNNVEGNFMDKYRLFVGAEVDLGDYHELSCRYIFQKEIQVANPHSSNIISIAYGFKLDGFVKNLKEPVKRIDQDQQIINWYRLPGN